MQRTLAPALVGLLVFGCGTDVATTAPTTSPPSPTEAATPATSPAIGIPTLPIVTSAPTAPTTLDLRDLVLLEPDGFDGAILNDVVVFQSRFLAGGSFGGPSGEPRRAAVWSSADGLEWSTVADEDAFATTFPTYVGLPGAGGIDALTADSKNVVAVGGFGEVWGSDIQAAAWYSMDGSVWHPAQVAGSRAAFMLDVSAGGPGFVAVGAAAIPDSSRTPSFAKGAIWTSLDGIDWKRVDTGPLFAKAIPDRVLVTDTGLLVALGLDKRALRTCSNCFDTGYLVWTSLDGEHWTRSPALRVGYAEDADAYGVAGDRVMGLHEGAMLATTDGATWAELDAAPGDFGAVLLGTATDILAIGPTAPSDEDPTLPAAWRWTAASGWGPPTIVTGADIPPFLVYGGAAAWGDVVVVVAGYEHERNQCECYPFSVVLRGSLGE